MIQYKKVILVRDDWTVIPESLESYNDPQVCGPATYDWGNIIGVFLIGEGYIVPVKLYCNKYMCINDTICLNIKLYFKFNNV